MVCLLGTTFSTPVAAVRSNSSQATFFVDHLVITTLVSNDDHQGSAPKIEEIVSFDTALLIKQKASNFARSSLYIEKVVSGVPPPLKTMREGEGKRAEQEKEQLKKPKRIREGLEPMFELKVC